VRSQRLTAELRHGLFNTIISTAEVKWQAVAHELNAGILDVSCASRKKKYLAVHNNYKFSSSHKRLF
jgi:hypothetical protein